MPTYPDWFLKHPYVPKPDQQGERDGGQLHMLVGVISHNWECLESKLYDLYMRLMTRAHAGVGGVNLGAYDAIYGAIISTTARREIILALAESVFLKMSHQYKELSRLLELVKRIVGRRNDAVHGLVAPLTHNNEQLGYFVMPPNYVPIRSFDADGNLPDFQLKYRLNAKTLEESAEAISALTDEIDVFITQNDL